MGDVPKTIPRAGEAPPTAAAAEAKAIYQRWDGCSHADPWIEQLSHSPALARIAARLMGTEAIRFYYDHMFVKTPSTDRGRDTPWHQDLPHHPLDRAGVLTMWIPLVDCPPEKGTLRFMSGSHRGRLLGRYLNRSDEPSLIAEHPWVLEEYEVSPPLHLRAGDATVHDLAIIHSAPENTTDSPRWVYVCQWLHPLTRYTGAPNYRTDGTGVEIDTAFDHPRFPLIRS
jgi:ectoine hydroxylase-related dioxygenase (phytanoyl-CoA dioxygenase family)